MLSKGINFKPDAWLPPLVVLLGMGMGRHDLSQDALLWLNRAEVIAGGKRHLDCFTEHCGEKIVLQSCLQDSLEELDRISRIHRTAVLASGDPFFFGLGRRLVGQLGKDRVLAFPNITTVQALFGRLKEPWEDVKVISLHGRRGLPERAQWLRELRYHARLALFTDPHHTPDGIARLLLDARISDRVLVVAEDLGLPSETVQYLSPQQAAAMKFSPLNLVALLPRDLPEKDIPSVSRWPALGIPDEAFQHQAGLITKMEVRAVVLAQLQLKPDLVLWDLGAGSGSVAIEAARMGRLQGVVAVEKNPDRYRDLVENVKRFHCPEIHAIHGNASEVLCDLPDPDRVFIGGSGGELESVLDQVASRLRPGGRVVQTAVTFETLQAVRSFWSGRQFETTITQLQVNRSVPIGKSSRLDALNPVFIITISD